MNKQHMENTSLFRFDSPGRGFHENIPLGNGILGAMISGDPFRETITLNHYALWSGYEHDAVNPKARESISKMRDAYFAGKYAECDEIAAQCLMRKMPYGDSSNPETPFGAYLPLGKLEIVFPSHEQGEIDDYKRQLDIATGICSVQYKLDNILLKREYFTSFSDDVFAMRLHTPTGKRFPLEIRLERQEAKNSILPGNRIGLEGEVYGANKYYAIAQIRTDGEVNDNENAIKITQATQVEIILFASTTLSSERPQETTLQTLEQSCKYTFSELLERHKKAFSQENGDFDIQIGNEPSDATSVSSFFQSLQDCQYDGYCATRFLMFSRYLLLSSSRKTNLPTTIQGIWNDSYRPPWNCDYHLNLNTQMIYWPAEALGLSHTHIPLLQWLKTLAKSGRNVAQGAFGANGWCAAWTSNPFGYAAPGNSLEWGLFPEAGAWMCMHIRDHYEYTLDLDFLKRFYPILQSACEFCLDMLTPDPITGKLLFGPTVAPEHGFISPDGKHCFIAWGTTTAQEIVWELFRFTLKAGKLIATYDELSGKIEKALTNLALPQIDHEGMLAKWIQPHTPDGARHLRHVFGLHPGTRLANNRNDDQTQALDKTLNDHEDSALQTYWGSGSWSGGWMVNLRTRLKQGEKAHMAVKRLIQKTLMPNMLAMNSDVFQLDGHSGCAAGIVEMLVQEYNGEIELLPALPDEWPNGRIIGVHVRGGFKLDFSWQGKTIQDCVIHSIHGGDCRLLFNGKWKKIRLAPQETKQIR